MAFIKAADRKTIHQLEGIRLRSCQLWLDAKGFHPFLDPDEMQTPDLQKSMGCTFAEFPKEAWDIMDRYDESAARRCIYATT